MSDPDRLLLDTHAAVWLSLGQLDAGTEEILADYAGLGGVFVSPITAWELGMLSRPDQRRSTLAMLGDPLQWFDRLLSMSFVRLAPCTPAMLVAATRLPGDLHGDPADRLLIATAREMKCPLATRDTRIKIYAEAGHLQVIPC